MMDEPPRCFMGGRGEGVSRGEGGYAGCSMEGHFLEEEVYGKKVSVGLQCIAGCHGESTGD